jgi:hypothetical protein
MRDARRYVVLIRDDFDCWSPLDGERLTIEAARAAVEGCNIHSEAPSHVCTPREFSIVEVYR